VTKPFARRWALASFFLLTACGIKTEYIPLNASPRPMQPRRPEEVEMFTTSRPDRPFIEVGTIEVQQEKYNSSTAAEIMNALRVEGAQRGCEGLIVFGDNDSMVVESSGSKGNVHSTTLKGYRATCIVYKTMVASAAPPPPNAPAP
jgi:hypothetical protein